MNESECKCDSPILGSVHMVDADATQCANCGDWISGLMQLQQDIPREELPEFPTTYWP